MAKANKNKKLVKQAELDSQPIIDQNQNMSITSPPIKGNHDLMELAKSLHNKDFNVKTIILEKWEDFRDQFKGELEENKDSLQLIEAIDCFIKAWDPTIAKKPFYELVPNDKFIYC